MNELERRPTPAELKAKCEQLAEYGRKSLKVVCYTFLGMRDWSKFHDELADFLEHSGPYKHIEVARGHLKSSLITKGWTIQQVLRNFDLRVLIDSAVSDNSERFLRSIQKYMQTGGLLSQVFGVFESDLWNQEACTVRQRTKILDAPSWTATGMNKEQVSQHYDLIVADDLVTRQNIASPEMREKVKMHIRDLYDLLEPKGNFAVVGTRWHMDDAYGDLLDNKAWDRFIRTAYTDDSRTQVLFPQKFSLEKLAGLRAVKGPVEFAAQYLNNPIDESTADFKSDQIRYYDPTTANPTSLYLTIDPAISLGRDADYSALVVAGQFANRRIRVVDRVHRRMVPSDLVDAIFELVAKWRLHRVGIETFSFQKTLKYDIQRQQRERGIFFSIDELGKRHTGKGESDLTKAARIRRLQPYFEQGLVELRSDMSDVVDELLSFPRGRHDDLIDALSYQLDYLVPSQAGAPQKDEGYMSVNWWLKNHMPKDETKIWERYMAA
jgi:predicted phage terminase large subunit-like protein